MKLFLKILLFIFTMFTTAGEAKSSAVVNFSQEVVLSQHVVLFGVASPLSSLNENFLLPSSSYINYNTTSNYIPVANGRIEFAPVNIEDIIFAVKGLASADARIFGTKAADQAAHVVARDGMQSFTKSNLQMGQQMHKAYKADLVNKVTTFKEFGKVPSVRPDFVDFSTKTIYELKPFNPRGIQQGWEQLYRYQSAFQQQYGGTWKIVLDLY